MPTDNNETVTVTINVEGLRSDIREAMRLRDEGTAADREQAERRMVRLGAILDLVLDAQVPGYRVSGNFLSKP